MYDNFVVLGILVCVCVKYAEHLFKSLHNVEEGRTPLGGELTKKKKVFGGL